MARSRVMDIHRARFVPYPPAAINALAFSHSPDTGLKGRGPLNLRLAIGRANGDIEIWNPLKGVWVQETILRGGKDQSIEGLAWTQDPASSEAVASGHPTGGRLRLFSIGYSSTVTEWDLETGKPARQANANFGEIWCMAAQPQWKSHKDKSGKTLSDFTGQHLALGCADGTIVIMSTEDGDLRYVRTLGQPPTKRPRVLSITFKDRNTVVAGYSDSTIRAFDIRNKILLRNMSLGSGPVGGPKEILVWSVKCLPDGTIVSGDSTGEIRFWDSKNYSLFQRLHSHDADILDITTSADGETIVSGGADRRTIVYKLQAGKKGDRRRRWVKVMHRRFHSHDVKALAAFETQDLSIVVSGGLDTTPILIPLRTWQKENHRTLSNLPSIPQMSSSTKARIVVNWWDQEINLWHIPKVTRSFEDPHRLLSRLLIQGEDRLTSVNISEDGKMLAVGTNSEVRLFSLTISHKLCPPSLKVRKVALPSSVTRNGGRLVVTSPDSRWLCIVRPNNNILVVKITLSTGNAKRPEVAGHSVWLSRPSRNLQSFKKEHGSLGDYSRQIRCAAFSADSRILAVGDLSGFVDSWVLEGIEDTSEQVETPKINGVSKSASSSSSSDSDSSDDDSSDDDSPGKTIQGQHWLRNPTPSLLPCLGSAILALSFRSNQSNDSATEVNGNVGVHATRHNPHPHSHDLPKGEDRLVAVTAEHRITEFDVLKGKLSDWSRRNPSSFLPRDFTLIKDRVMGCFWDISHNAQRLWLYGPKWLCMLDLAQDLPSLEDSSTVKVQAYMKNALGKRKRDGAAEPRRENAGAGDAIDVAQSYVGVGKAMRKLVGADESSAQLIPLESQKRPGSDDDDDDHQPPVDELDLSRTRRAASGDEKDVDGSDRESHEGDQRVDGLKSRSKEGRGFWYTFKYGPVLGILPMRSSEEVDHVQDGAEAVDGQPANADFDIVIIERPLWDVDLPPRYDGGQDWET